ncbi:50S ribosomal protein L18 [Candidatus Liberibacter brunswickensis]|uniref:50S ribosomal protein L18 n=1 Tax=Candidatus Liberibacter brunswickensis TaxID=1968796 RepID=UPI002FE0EBD3
MAVKKKVLDRRLNRIRQNLKSVSKGRLRLNVYRSSSHIYGQIIDDFSGHTLAACSSLNEKLLSYLKNGSNKVAATAVGGLLAKRAVAVGIEKVYFDRGKNLYCGRVAALADAVRKGGIEF